MSDNLIFNVNLDLLFKAGITINQYLVLELVQNKKKELFRQYMELFHKSPVSADDLRDLISKGFLKTIDGKDRFTFENLKVTKLFTDLNNVDVNSALEELESTYPKVTPLKRRRLHVDKDKWSKKYLEIIKKDKSLHDKIILCIKAEIQHRQKTDQEEFYPLLSTYVNNKRWEQYLDDIDGFKVKEIVSNNYDI